MSRSDERRTGSETTGTALAEQKGERLIGSLLGEIGSAMTLIDSSRGGHATPEAAAHIKRSMMQALQLPLATIEQRQMLSAAADALSREATAKWTVGRITTLLSHYYVSDADERLAAAMLDDWVQELREFPAWAIANACRWWLSRENPRRKYKPAPGDISERAYEELEVVRAARIAASRPVIPFPAQQEEAKPCTPEQRAEIDRLVKTAFPSNRK